MCVSSRFVFTLKHLLGEAKEMKLPVRSSGTTHPTMLWADSLMLDLYILTTRVS